MRRSERPIGDALFDLMCKRETVGLDPGEEREYRRLIESHPGLGMDGLGFTAAVLHSGLTTEAEEVEVPRHLRERLSSDARVFLAGRSKPLPSLLERNRGGGPETESRRLGWQTFSGWLVAAAALFYLMIGRTHPTRASWEELASRAQPLAWQGTADAAARDPSGGVLWDQEGQRGWMRISGLEANDPDRSQYQLWIFDRGRPESTPVDGGVFDVASDGEVLIPIEAKLEVFDPTLFAVTVEEPGGVVVSGRQRIVLTATP